MTMQAVEEPRKVKRNKRSRRALRNAERVRTNPKRTITAIVSSPSVPGATEKLEVVIDTVFAMRRRRQIDEPSWLAAETYRKAYDLVGASQLGGVMDFDRARGGRPGGGHSEAELIAAGTLNEASKALGLIDGRVVELVVGCNWNIAEAARALFGPDAKTDRACREDCEHLGKRLRMGLEILSELWHPAPKPRLRGWREVGAKPLGGQAGNRDIQISAVTGGPKRT